MTDSLWVWKEVGRREDHSKWTGLLKTNITERWVTKLSQRITTKSKTLITVIKDPREDTLFQT